jgi:hypothetical protein
VKLRFRAGGHWAWQIRICLQRARYFDPGLTYVETGWLRRTFAVEGPQKALETIERECRELEIPIRRLTD